MKRHGNSEQYKEFLNTHDIPEHTSRHCRQIAANWDQIKVIDPVGKSLQEISETLKQLAAETMQTP